MSEQLFQIWVWFKDGRTASLHVFEDEDDAREYCERISSDLELMALFGVDYLSTHPMYPVPKGGNR
jgi:hypothetical protein